MILFNILKELSNFAKLNNYSDLDNMAQELSGNAAKTLSYGALMGFAERMTAKHAPNFYLCVSSFNRLAQAFYRKCGYEKIGRIDGLIRNGASERIYWKKLREDGNVRSASTILRSLSILKMHEEHVVRGA